MKLTIEKEKLLPTLQVVCNIVSRRPTLPIEANLLFEVTQDTLTVTAKNPEIELSSSTEHPADEIGKVTLPARKLLDICRALPVEATIDLDISDDKATLKSGKSKFTLQTLPASDFPSRDVSQSDSDASFTLSESTFSLLLEDTMFSMSNQDVRYYLNGLLLELRKDILRFVATDGHRLAMREAPLENSTLNLKNSAEALLQIIIPRKSVLELARLLDNSGNEEVTLNVNQNQLTVIKAGMQLTSTLIDGKFPDYEKVIPEEVQNQIKVGRDMLQAILTRASILSSEKYKGVRLLFKSGLLRVLAKNTEAEEAEEETEIIYDGQEIEMGFNVSYLLDILSALRTEHAVLYLRDQSSSCLICPDDESKCKYVVMPMRL